MRLGFDTTPLLAPASGIGTYVRNLLDHLPLVPATALEIVPVANHTAGRLFGRSMRSNKTFWMQTVLPRVASQQRLGLCHFTNNVSALWMPCPTVVTIHDMTLWLYPQHHYAKRLLAMRPVVPLAARRAAAVIAVSESAKSDIVRLLRVPCEKVHVIHEAAAPCFRPLPCDPTRQADLRRRYDLPDRYVLVVGTVEPRKNLVRLLEAFAQLISRDPQPAGMVFVGGRGWKDDAVFAAVERLALHRHVRFLGLVPVDDLVGLYNQAEVLAFPSLYEGFGLPVVEAMACGVPVLTSRCGSLAEVAGDAAQIVDPLNVESIAEGLWCVLSDPARQEHLRAKGLLQASRFSWMQAAAQTVEVYRQAVHE